MLVADTLKTSRKGGGRMDGKGEGERNEQTNKRSGKPIKINNFGRSLCVEKMYDANPCSHKHR